MSRVIVRRKIHPKYLYLGAIVVLLIGTGYLSYSTWSQAKKIDMLLAERNYFLLENASSTQSLLEERELASSTIAELSSRLSLTAEELDDIEDDYRKEKNKNDEFEDQIKKISGTVGVLDKLSKTDKELLQKYSKVYFLNEHYIPEKIVPIEKKYLYNEAISKSIHGKVEPYLNDMIEAALADGIKIWVVSAYRSFNEQASLKGAYTQTYGSGANTFSADQGYSEHQLGTTLDFTTEGLGGGLDGFEGTPAYTWMLENASKYGFTLSYPKGNAYYVFEPWHWRFVGEDLAKDLDKADASFYDWEQRKIDEYLISIFD
ncbi:MAG: M15 family metallopeptidase [Patescibacteria group bacterium]